MKTSVALCQNQCPWRMAVTAFCFHPNLLGYKQVRKFATNAAVMPSGQGRAKIAVCACHPPVQFCSKFPVGPVPGVTGIHDDQIAVQSVQLYLACFPDIVNILVCARKKKSIESGLPQMSYELHDTRYTLHGPRLTGYMVRNGEAPVFTCPSNKPPPPPEVGLNP